jgi:hypothetical protein
MRFSLLRDIGKRWRVKDIVRVSFGKFFQASRTPSLVGRKQSRAPEHVHLLPNIFYQILHGLNITVKIPYHIQHATFNMPLQPISNC